MDHDHRPLEHLNETEVLRLHGPDPPSYWDYDADPTHSSHATLLFLHVFGMVLAFLLLLPTVIAMRIARNRWQPLCSIVFQVIVGLSSFSGTLYAKLTPNRYEGTTHGLTGYVLIIVAAFIGLIDASSSIKKFVSLVRSGESLSPFKLWRLVIDHATHPAEFGYTTVSRGADLENVGLKIFDEPEEESDSESPREQHVRFGQDTQDFSSPRATSFDDSARSDSSTLNGHGFGSRHNSLDLEDAESTRASASIGVRICHLAFITIERALVPLSFAQFLSGVIVYTGICQRDYVFGCLAHFIKGGIFFGYGLLTFARFLGVYADLGWAWNYFPGQNKPLSAEFVESFMMFFYGITNTWMERFGAEPGSALTARQVQHISIAVMFWFGGLIGMAIESRRFRRWLGSAAAMSIKPGREIIEPKPYMGSFNPIPAIVIGITGSAMSAHHQAYLFQVQIHQLWGNFLVGFAVLRCLTCFFLWLRPPHSILPSRPPTELVASFLLTCGGIAFIFSTEQISFIAMRHEHADVMMFLNLTVAIACLSFCWVLGVLSFKGWLSLRGRSML